MADEKDFDKYVGESITDLFAVLDLPEDLKVRILEAFARQILVDHMGFEAAINKLQLSLDNLQVCVKYQTFDLEATRRENKRLEQIIEKMLLMEGENGSD